MAMVTHTLQGRSLLQRRGSLPNTLLALMDGVAVISTFYLTTTQITNSFSPEYMVALLLLMGAMGVTYDRLGIYRNSGSLLRKLLALWNAWALSFAVLVVLAFLTKQAGDFSRLTFTLIFVVGFALQALAHASFKALASRSLVTPARDKALVIGSGPLADSIADRINHSPWSQETVIGRLSISHQEIDQTPGASVPALSGSVHDIAHMIKEHDIRTVYIAVALDGSPLIEKIYFDLLDLHVNIHWAPNIFSLNLINHSVTELSGIPIITLSETPLTGTRLAIKSLEDRIISMSALVLLAPVMLLIAIAIKIDSPGPVFYRQPRTGWDGREFLIWKFRSMHVHRPANGEVKQATRDDPRITRVGKFIRRTSTDELPQLFNVLCGQMSIVGPRPHAVEHNIEYSQRIRAYMARHRIKPGITGLAQVRGYRGETKELNAMTKRVESDLEYINNWSLLMDIGIILRTALSFFRRSFYENAY